MNTVCPVCGSELSKPFVSRADVPMLQNMLYATREAAIAAERGTLDICHCETCDFVTNASFQADEPLYGPGYNNDQAASGVFRSHLDAVVRDLIHSGVKGRRVLEIGSGTGDFLRDLCQRGDNSGIGFDPAYKGPPSILEGRVEFVPEYYVEDHPDGARADAVVSRHVIEHIPEPIPLLELTRTAMREDGGAIAVFETPDVEWILRNEVVQDFFYEHCSYWSKGSLRRALVLSGLRPIRVDNVFGGQYLMAVAERGNSASPAARESPQLGRLTREYASALEARLVELLDALRQLRAAGRLAVWGAGAKGCTFINLLDPRGELIDVVIDLNPAKQGKFLPGSGHPVEPPTGLAEREITNVVVMNPQYLDEIRELSATLSPATSIQAFDAPDSR